MQKQYIKDNVFPLIEKLMVLLFMFCFGFLFSNDITTTTSSKDLPKEAFFYVLPNTVVTNTEQIHIDRNRVKVKTRRKFQQFAQKEKKREGAKKIKKPQSVFYIVMLTDRLGKREGEGNFVSVGSTTNDRKKVFSVDFFVALWGVFLFFFFSIQNQRDSTWWFLLGFYKHIYKSRPPPVLRFFY